MIAIQYLLCSILLASSLIGSAQEKAKREVPPFLMGKVDGKQITLNILPEGAAPVPRKLKGTRFINVEPGCIMLEAYVKLIGEKKLEIHMPHDDGSTTRAMKKMGVVSKRVVMTFEPSKAANQAGSFVVVKPSETKSSEQGGARQPATAADSKSQGKEKPKSEQKRRSQ